MKQSSNASRFICVLIFGISSVILSGCGSRIPNQRSNNHTITPQNKNISHTNSPASPTASPAPSPGQSRVDEKGIEQVWVPPGSFMMGTEETNDLEPPSWAERELASEQPQHKVEITAGFWIDTYEVTNDAYQAFIDDGGYLRQEYWSEDGLRWLNKKDVDKLPFKCVSKSQPAHPQVCITWYEAQAYAHWRSGRLPTEAEWEYAARGPESNIYPWGNEWDTKKANVVDSDGLTPVGSYPEGISWIGAHDMSGNAMEWVQDWLDTNYYQAGDMIDPQGPEKGGVKVEKGGWWDSHPFVARAAYRHFEDPPGYQDHHIGFRVVIPEQHGDTN